MNSFVWRKNVLWSCVLCKTTSAETGFHIPHFLSYVFRIPKPRIPDPISKNFPHSGLYKQKFPRLRIVQAKISSIPDCTSKNFPRFRIITSKNFPDSGLYKQKFPGLRNPNSLSWGKWRVDLLFQSLRNGFILNRLQQWLSWVTKNGICTHGILSVSGVTRSPTRAPTTSPPWQFFFKQNRCRRQKKWFYSKNKLDS